jgi:cytidylate kinase
MEKKFVVTIGREFGTGGRQIAVELAKLLGVELYDKGLLQQLEERYNMTQEDLDRVKGLKKSWWFETISQDLYNDEEFIVRSLAEKESCVILGRTGFHIFRDNPNAFKVFLIADKDFRRAKVAKRLSVDEGSADLLINKVDEARENFTHTFSGKSRYDARNYDLVLNVAGQEPKQIALFIAECVKNNFTSCVGDPGGGTQSS